MFCALGRSDAWRTAACATIGRFTTEEIDYAISPSTQRRQAP
jgi:hypothetical protein